MILLLSGSVSVSIVSISSGPFLTGRVARGRVPSPPPRSLDVVHIHVPAPRGARRVARAIVYVARITVFSYPGRLSCPVYARITPPARVVSRPTPSRVTVRGHRIRIVSPRSRRRRRRSRPMRRRRQRRWRLPGRRRHSKPPRRSLPRRRPRLRRARAFTTHRVWDGRVAHCGRRSCGETSTGADAVRSRVHKHYVHDYVYDAFVRHEPSNR